MLRLVLISSTFPTALIATFKRVEPLYPVLAATVKFLKSAPLIVQPFKPAPNVLVPSITNTELLVAGWLLTSVKPLEQSGSALARKLAAIKPAPNKRAFFIFNLSSETRIQQPKRKLHACIP